MNGTKSASLWKDGVCLGSAFFGGVVGNLAAAVAWEAGKYVLQPLLDKIPTLTDLLARRDAGQNHDLLRALRRAECDAVVAVVDQVLVSSHGLRSDDSEIVQLLKARLRQPGDPDLAILLRMRRRFRMLARKISDSTPSELGAIELGGAGLSDVSGIVATGREVLSTGSHAALQERTSQLYLDGLGKFLAPDPLPATFRDLFVRVEGGWFTALGLAFREQLKTNDRARIAFELDCQTLLPEFLGRDFTELELRLERQEELATATLAETVALRRKLDSSTDEILGELEALEETALDQLILVREIHEKVAAPPAEKQPRIPQEVKAQVREGNDFFNDGHFEQAEAAYRNALASAERLNHPIAVVHTKQHLAMAMLQRGNASESKTLLEECLETLALVKDDEEHSAVLDRLAHLYDREGDSETSEALERQSLTMAERRGDRLDQADALVKLAWTIGRRGRTDEAIELNERAHQVLRLYLHDPDRNDDNPSSTRSFVHGLLANLFLQRAKISQRAADPDAADRALGSALEWQRKNEPNHELAKILIEVARLKLFRREIDQGVSCLQEAASILQERALHGELARCLELLGRVHAQHGSVESAEQLFKAAVGAALAGHDKRLMAEPLQSLAHLAAERGQADAAREYLSAALGLIDDDETRGECLAQLSRAAAQREEEQDAKRLLAEAAEAMTRAVAGAGDELSRARAQLTLAHYLRELGRPEEALTVVLRAKGTFERAGDMRGQAEAWFESGGLQEQLGRFTEARDTVQNVRRFVEGKPFPDLLAVSDLTLARFALSDRDLPGALRLAQIAVERCKKHALPWLAEALHTVDQIEARKKQMAPSDLSLDELIDELQEQVTLCPANKEGYVRLWVFCRAPGIVSNLSAVLHANVAVVTQDLATFLEVAAWLKPYRSWALLVTPEDYPPNLWEFIPFSGPMRVFRDGIALLGVKKGSSQELKSPDGEKFHERVRISPEIRAHLNVAPVSAGGAVGRYHFCSAPDDRAESGGADGGVVGWSLALPRVVHDLIQDQPASRLKSERLFFVYYNRGALDADERLENDLRMAHGLRTIPVYVGQVPLGDGIEVVASCNLVLPTMSDELVATVRVAVRNVQAALVGLFDCDKRSAAVALNHFAATAEDLGLQLPDINGIKISCLMLRFDRRDRSLVHPALVVRRPPSAASATRV